MGRRQPPSHKLIAAESPDGAEETKRRLEGIVASAMDGIITVDDAQRIILFNPAAERMFGVSSAEALGEHISRFIPERFRATHAAHIERFIETGVTDRRMGALGAISGLRTNGEEFPIEASISQIGVGGATLATVILRDITERKANEEARLLLAREVDHRAKNALAVVQAVVSLTRAPTIEAFVAAVRGRVSALGRAHSLLAQTRWEGGDLARIAANETAAYHLPDQIEFRGPPIMVNPDVVQPLSLLFHELATNAAKYGALSIDAGRVIIDWRVLSDHSLQLGWSETGGPPVTEPAATGFGSTLITEVTTRQLGGRLDIDWLRQGLRLVVVLPASTFRPEAPADRSLLKGEAVEPAAPPRAGRLMLVEDEALVAMELANILAAAGWEIMQIASTVGEALALIASGPVPDAAILDINLRGESVYPVANLLQTKGVPFVFCTGYEQIEESERYPQSAVLRKPVDVRHLINELRRMQPGL